MKKLVYLFVMIAGMTLSVVNVYAQDAKCASATVKKEATAACCKSSDKMADGKCCKKETASACVNKVASTTSQNLTDKKGTCCKTKTEATASDAKGTNSTK